VVYRDEDSVKCEGLFLGLEVPRGVEKKDNRKNKIVEDEKIVDEAFFGREKFPRRAVLCRGKEFFCKF